MLVELHCDKFKSGKITFHQGLNVVLGDSVASNSIGKSTLLMVLDFVFGGDSLLEHNSDVVRELGDHDYLFVFDIGGERHIFKRNTATPDLVHSCNSDYSEADPISISDYRTILKGLYRLGNLDLTFRSIVSLYSRVWGKENLDVKLPLHSHKKQKATDCIDTFIKLYERYDEIDELSKHVKELDANKKSINSAYRQKLIPKINKTGYKDNLQAVRDIDTEISDIRENLAKYAISIREIVDRKTSELKQSRDALVQEKSKVSSRLKRVQNDLAKNKHVKSKAFQSLIKFFPEANAEKLTEVEEFHSKITRILKSELKESEETLLVQLEEINDAIASIDERLSEAFLNIDNPSEIIDRVHALSKKHSIASRELQYFEHDVEVSADLKSAKAKLSEEKQKVSKLISDIVNNKVRKLVDQVYDERRASPKLAISDTNYSFSAVEDTGTGKAYSSLLLMDLAVFSTTVLPFLIHDSVLFKNIENEAVAKLIELYVTLGKQTFIAIDEIQKYGETAQRILEKNMVIQLADDQQLYIKDWRV